METPIIVMMPAEGRTQRVRRSISPAWSHPHLHHRVLGGVFQTEQRVGHADFVVLVTLGLEGVAESRQHRIAEFLGGGLAHAARHADDAGTEQHAVVGSHADHGQGTVRHHHGAVRRDALHRVIGNDIGPRRSDRHRRRRCVHPPVPRGNRQRHSPASPCGCR